MLVTTLQAGAEGKRPIEDALIQAETASQIAAAPVEHAPHVQAPVILPAEMTGEAVQEDSPPKTKGPPKRKRRKVQNNPPQEVAVASPQSGWSALPIELKFKILDYLRPNVFMPRTPWAGVKQALLPEEARDLCHIGLTCRAWFRAVQAHFGPKYTLLCPVPIRSLTLRPPGESIAPLATREQSQSDYRLFPQKTVFTWDTHGRYPELEYVYLRCFQKVHNLMCRAAYRDQLRQLSDQERERHLAACESMRAYFWKQAPQNKRYYREGIWCVDINGHQRRIDVNAILPFFARDHKPPFCIDELITYPAHAYLNKTFPLKSPLGRRCYGTDRIPPEVLRAFLPADACIKFFWDADSRVTASLRALPPDLQATFSRRIAGINLPNQCVTHFSDAGMPNLKKLVLHLWSWEAPLKSLEEHPLFRAPKNKESLQNLETLSLSGRNKYFTYLPNMPNLTTLSVHDGYDALQDLNQLQNLRHLTVVSAAITSLELPHLTTLEVWQCNQLVSLDLPSAQKVEISRCNQLASLDLPYAVQVSLSNCEKLRRFKLPKVVEAKIDLCAAPISLDLPAAVKVELLQYEESINLVLPKVQDLILEAWNKNDKSDPWVLSGINKIKSLKKLVIRAPRYCLSVRPIVLENCPSLPELRFEKIPMPKFQNCEAITSLCVEKCPELIDLCHLAGLKEVEINRCTGPIRIHDLPTLRQCSLKWNNSVSFVGDLPKLHSLTICYSKYMQEGIKLKAVSAHMKHSGISALTLKNMPALRKCAGKRLTHSLPAVIENCGRAEPELRRRFG